MKAPFTGIYDTLLFFMPFTNELVNLARSIFNLPIWIYNPTPTKPVDIFTKLMIDTVSLYGVILNLLEASATNFDTLILSTLGLVLLVFSFVIPTFLVPYITTSNIPARDLIAFGVIVILAVIDRIAIDLAEEYQNLQAEVDNNLREQTKGRAVYYFIALVLALLSVIYITKMHFNYSNTASIFSFLLVIGFGILIIEKYMISETKIQKHHAPISNELLE